MYEEQTLYLASQLEAKGREYYSGQELSPSDRVYPTMSKLTFSAAGRSLPFPFRELHQHFFPPPWPLFLQSVLTQGLHFLSSCSVVP